jgi:hypothetical protein
MPVIQAITEVEIGDDLGSWLAQSKEKLSTLHSNKLAGQRGMYIKSQLGCRRVMV